jgi:1-deoxyxylulose-5-phosphate synthase
MDYVNLGRSGLKVSRLALGCMTFGDKGWAPWALGEAEGRVIMTKALDIGINFFDTADMYSRGASETIVGNVLKDLRKRDELVIATKLYTPMSNDPNDRGLSRKHIRASIDASLKRLQTDHVDLYQAHRYDYDTPLEETLDAFNGLVRAGKVLYLGASNWPAWRFAKALELQRRYGWAPFIAMQNHYNLLYREEEREMLPLCLAEGIGVIPWSPLARGMLAGKHKPGEKRATTRGASDRYATVLYGEDPDRAIVAAVADVAQRLGRPPAQVAYAWVATRPSVVAPIVGASRPEQLDDALACLDLKLSDDDVKALEAPYRPRAVAG